MNRTHQSIWNDSSGTFVAAAESASGAGKKKTSCTTGRPSAASFAISALSACLMFTFGASVHALPVGGVVAAGGASITGSTSTTTITQSTANVVINWQSFSIGTGQTVQFVQPGNSSVALNRVLGADPSSIMGSLTSNGKVFLLNPNGILFGSGASVNVGGLVASTLSLTDADFMAGTYAFTDAGSGTVVNQGSINAANGGYVALMGKSVSNQGVISARLGSVALAAGNAITMDVAGDGLLNIAVAQGAVNALVENGGLIRADGGRVLLTAQAAGDLLHTVVNNTGVIQAQTLENRNGRILLLGDMQTGTVNVGGTLDASAPNGGNGGFIETSAAHVNIQDSAQVTTAAAQGLVGTWLIDPQDFIIGAGGNISGATLSALLVTNSVTISTSTGPDATVAGTPPVTGLNTAMPGNGDIFVNEAVSWSASSSPTTLTLNAARDVNVNSAVSATNGNFVVCCGRDVNVNAPITTVNGSVLLSAGRNINQNAAMTTTDGNITMCAAQDINIGAQITLTRGSSIPGQSLGLPLGLVLRADADGTGPGVTGGTVIFAPLTPPSAVTGPNAPVTIYYNPVSYTSPTDYAGNFTLTGGSTLTQHMLVFPEAIKTYDGTTSAIFTSLKGNPSGVGLIAGPGSTATFDTPDAGTGKPVTFSGYSLDGPNASQYALAYNCCAPIVGQTTGNIIPAIIPTIIPAIIPDGGEKLPYIALSTPALASFAAYRPGLMPTYTAGTGDVYLSVKDVAVQEEIATPAIIAPPVTPPPYVAPRYAPKPARN